MRSERRTEISKSCWRKRYTAARTTIKKYGLFSAQAAATFMARMAAIFMSANARSARAAQQESEVWQCPTMGSVGTRWQPLLLLLTQVHVVDVIVRIGPPLRGSVCDEKLARDEIDGLERLRA